MRHLQAPDERVLHAMASLTVSRDFQVVHEFLKDSVKELHERVETTEEDVHLRFQQGALQVLGEILSLASDSVRMLERKRQTATRQAQRTLGI